MHNNYSRYAEDCAIVLDVLAPRGFVTEAVFADGTFQGLAPNGTIVQGRGANRIQSIMAASKANALAALSRCADASNRGDFCIIYVTDHGNVDATVNPYRGILGLWGRDMLKDDEFFGALSKAKSSRLVLIFQQCNAGSFALPHESLGFEMCGAARHGFSYATTTGQHDAFTGLLFEAVDRGASLATAVRYVAKRNNRPEDAWHVKPWWRRSIRLGSG